MTGNLLSLKSCTRSLFPCCLLLLSLTVAACSDEPATTATPVTGSTNMRDALVPLLAEADSLGIRLSVGVQALGAENSELILAGSSAPYPPASTIKLLLLATLMQQVDTGALSLDQTAAVTAEDIVGGFGVLQNEPVPQQVTLFRLAELMVTISDNTATNVLVDVVGYDDMRRVADELGFESTQFGRKMFEAAQPPEKENWITAADTMILLREIYQGSFLSAASRQQILDWMGAQTVKTKIAAGVPAGTPIAHKTGENAGVSHDIGYLLIPRRETALAIFTESLHSTDFETVQAQSNPFVAKVAAAVHGQLVSGRDHSGR